MVFTAARPWSRVGATGCSNSRSIIVLGLAALVGSNLAGPAAGAETGDVLVAYRSRLGTLPAAQGWQHLGLNLSNSCPASPTACRWQGAVQNSCRSGEGCRLPESGLPATEHYNAPPATATGDYTYTEWFAFDDGDDHFDLPYPATSARNLTIADSLWGPHVNPAFGAPWFANAPTNHLCLRLVNGGGVPRVTTLPNRDGSMRNTGQACMQAQLATDPQLGAVTLLATMAAGNRDPGSPMIQLQALGRALCVGVDGGYASSTVGRLTWGTEARSEMVLFVGKRVAVACSRPGVAGPQAGEFFTLRLVLRADGTFTAWLNEDLASARSGVAGQSTSSKIRVNPCNFGDAGVMWVDQVEIRVGELPPDPCADPVFDVDRNGEVDAADLTGPGGFVGCATGPASAAIWANLPQACRCMDVNGDESVDMVDYAAFQRCWSAQTPLPDVDVACDR